MESRFEHLLVPLAVAVGGALGSLARWALAGAVVSDGFPRATFTANVVGSFALGVVLVVGELVGTAKHRRHRSSWARLWRPFMATGVLGGFTTFSTFVLEVDRLGDAVALLYLVLSLGLGLLAYAMGNLGARMVFGVRR